ncbi:pyridoxal-phosphate dependent enzyme [Streptomyces sp. NPDC127098]|uniref:pyridoxal-phosphate dependent enzyme n=1 Tax=Streptomyces sp. NPDC127098 TaxID=3347137 RepID=UPI0036501BF9
MRSTWSQQALRRLIADGEEARPTPLRPVPLPGVPDVALHLKDESALPTGSLKHRHAQAMLHRAVATGAVGPGTPLVVATGGPFAVAAAHLATLIGLPLTALVPPKVPAAVRARVEAAGGHCRLAEGPPAALQQEARALAARLGGHFLDHFADAAPAMSDYPGPTVADEIEARPGSPAWLVTGAASGTTAATLGRLAGRLAVADPEHSAYFAAWASDCRDYATGMPSRVPGIGRPRVEPGFPLDRVDLVIPVPDAATLAALRWLHTLGIPAGPATGTTLWAACHLAARLHRDATPGTVVAIMGDTTPTPTWPAATDLDPTSFTERLTRLATTGDWDFSPG